jgi:hypothetical protein
MDHAPSTGQMRNGHKVSAAIPERKISLENKRRCEDNLKRILDKYGVRNIHYFLYFHMKTVCVLLLSCTVKFRLQKESYDQSSVNCIRWFIWQCSKWVTFPYKSAPTVL